MATRRPSFICASCLRTLKSTTKPQTARQFASTSIRSASEEQDLPRWQQPPPAMKMPIRLRPEPRQPKWRVNKDEDKLNEAYDKFLGSVASGRGSDLLDQETKWLAVTHKSHSHGSLGFNDRLAYLGKRIVDLQASLALLSAPASPLTSNFDPEHVYNHPSLEGLDNISVPNKMQVLDKTRLAKLAGMYGLDGVVRWKPKKSDNLEGSGVNTVMAHTIYSIVGAVAMQKGGDLAAKVARKRVLQPLGLR
ncbi:hypothetical protein PRZ48_007610 [Zasmidium cellare]|uniref:RNase III domain-containing protein n=1 Tax=Zasmidium cellare TaxID=395010 RepID=A0ABR0EKW5_ZASCE|nr:hypothetical protein PRZ48_007610 [Zasmidium cellare]